MATEAKAEKIHQGVSFRLIGASDPPDARSNLEHPAASATVPTDLGLLAEPKMTIREATKLMAMGETSLRRRIADGDLPAIRIGSKTLLLRRDCEAFLAGHYGVTRRLARAPDRLPPLPADVVNSEVL